MRFPILIVVLLATMCSIALALPADTRLPSGPEACASVAKVESGVISVPVMAIVVKDRGNPILTRLGDRLKDVRDSSVSRSVERKSERVSLGSTSDNERQRSRKVERSRKGAATQKSTSRTLVGAGIPCTPADALPPPPEPCDPVR
jgi:hypothetical protein